MIIIIIKTIITILRAIPKPLGTQIRVVIMFDVVSPVIENILSVMLEHS